MREHDAVVVPSRHEYPEGLANTVFEGLGSGSPLVVSDHPAWADRLLAGRDALQFGASDPRDLSAQVLRLIREPELYESLSRNGASALAGLYVGVERCELISRFIADPADATGWVQSRTLAAMERGRKLEGTETRRRFVLTEVLGRKLGAETGT